MPYKTNKDLPNNVRKYLPDGAQTIYRKVFNSAHESGKDEAAAIRIAWGVVKKSYQKNKQGKWVKKK